MHQTHMTLFLQATQKEMLESRLNIHNLSSSEKPFVSLYVRNFNLGYWLKIFQILFVMFKQFEFWMFQFWGD